MAPLRRTRTPQQTDEEMRAAEVDLERIRDGGIPLGAEQRLKRIASVGTPFFTSDLTAKEYALADASGLLPVAQVMGSSVVQRGWQGRQQGLYYTTGELTALAEPWNLARERAFDRLRQEADLAGADGVIGIEINAGSIGDPGNIELVVFGTAVRETVLSTSAHDNLGMCTLSGQDVDKLRRIGAAVRGVVGYTAVISVQLGVNSTWAMNSGGMLAGVSRYNVEIREISRGVYQARNRVLDEVRRQATAVGANNIVVSTLKHTIEHYEYESPGYRQHFFHVTMNILGTAIRLGAHKPHPGSLAQPLLSINLGD
ncbi:MAG: heavy metal-binding domain-containing protein [Solirubrobacteraceae bacterium]